MNLFTISMRSNALRKRTQFNVLVPENAKQPLRVLWALHGMTDDHTGWLRCTTIELLAEQYEFAVVVPNADLSFYVDMAYGADYFSFLSRELPIFIEKHFGTSTKKEDNFIIGNSMGGYGAFFTALSCPNQYAAAISLAGPMRIDWIHKVLSDVDLAKKYAQSDSAGIAEVAQEFSEKTQVPLPLVQSLMEFGDLCTVRTFQAMFGVGTELRGSKLDIFHLADLLAESCIPLKLMAYCGKQDYHYSSNLSFAEHLKTKTLDYSLVTGDGRHDWNYWNPAIESALCKLFA